MQTHVTQVRRALRQYGWHIICKMIESILHSDTQETARLCSIIYSHEHRSRHDVCQSVYGLTARFAHRP